MPKKAVDKSVSKPVLNSQSAAEFLYNSSAMLSSWQRRRLAEEPNRLLLSVEFGKPVDDSNDASAGSPSGSSPALKNTEAPQKKIAAPVKLKGKPQAAAPKESASAASIKSSLKNAMKSIVEGDSEWRLKINIEGFVAPEDATRMRRDHGVHDANGYLRLHPALWKPVDVSEHFKLLKEAFPPEGEGNSGDEKTKQKQSKKQQKKPEFVQCPSVIWFTLFCKDDMMREQAEVTREFAHRTFESIPYDYRSSIYKYVRSEVTN